MKKRELYNCLQALESVKDLKGIKFAYVSLKNKKKIEEEIKLFEEIVKPNPKFEEYEQNRIKLCEKHSEKNENGKPIILQDKYKITDEIKFNSELDELKKDYNSVINERIKQINDYNEMLEEELNIEFEKINFDSIPENISPKELESIDFMINFD